MTISRTLSLAALGASTIAFATTASASSVTTALFLNLDGSGSISSADYQLQVNAYANLLPNVATDGSVALGALVFSSQVNELAPLTTIDSEADLDTVINAITSTPQPRGATALGPSIIQAADAFISAGLDCESNAVNCLIDVSTDGGGNVGIDEDIAADDAVQAGIDQVNCLGVGSANCSFIAGKDAFSINVDSFADFETALEQKLTLEGVIQPGIPMDDPVDMTPSAPPITAVAPIPLPAPALMLLAGLAGLFGMRLRKAA